MPLPLPQYQSLGSIMQNKLNQNMNSAMQAQELQNAILKSKYLEPMTQANIASKNAETEKQNIFNKLPFAGKSIPGAGGEALGLQMIKNEFGENSPVYQNALNSYNLQNDKTNQLMSYQKALQQSLPKRTSTPLAKSAMEQRDIEQGFLPGTTLSGEGEKISPEKQKELEGRFSLKQLKDTTDPKTRERMLYANNIEKTINNINPKDLLQYSGPKGFFKYQKDKYSSGLGSKIPEFERFEESMTGAKLLGEQVRQFYGTSIQPEVKKDLEKLGDPSFWFRNPEVAEKKYNKYIKILNSEIDTFSDALSNTDIYKKKSLVSSAADITPENKKESYETKGDNRSNKKPAKTWIYNPSTGRLE